jgi:hypothetical protein
VAQLPDRCQRLLKLQRGVIASWQADQAGITHSRVRNLVRYGRWQPLQLGVYAAFSGEPSRDAVLWSAVLRAGPQAILSHETAAELDGLLDKRDKRIHVSVPHPQHMRPVPGLVIHRSSRIPQTRDPRLLPPRTMIDETVLDLVQGAASFDDVVALLARACQKRLTTPFLLSESLGLRAKARWRSEIDLALRDVADGVHSPLEYRYVRDVERAHGLPAAKRQGIASQHGGRIDGQASHPDERRWHDKHRDNAAAAEGLATLRYGWADVTERTCETAAEIAEVLRRRGWPGPLRRCGPNCRIAIP